MKSPHRLSKVLALAALASALLLTPAGIAIAASGVVYDSTRTPLPSNVTSVGFEAASADEIGDDITFAAGSRNIQTVTITMSSWACQTGAWQSGDCVTTPGATFTHPVTVNLYNVDRTGTSPVVGALIRSVTMTVIAPYRPSVSASCTGGKWADGAGQCFNGYAFNVDFDFAGVAVPNEIIYGIAYNTHTSGNTPLAVTGPYDSLNVGLTGDGINAASAVPAVGTDMDSDVVFIDTATGGNTFIADTGWTGYTVAAKFTTVAPPVLTAENCKNGGHLTLGFRNQGQCIASIVANDKSGK